MVAVPVVLLVAGATWSLLDLPATWPTLAFALYAACAALIVGTFPASLPGPGVGPANRVTLGRLALMVPLMGLAVSDSALGTVGRWWVIVLGTTIMVLDGVDGRVARRTRTESAWGARFDMETDACLMLVLSVLVWQEGRAGVWVLLIGAMRYLFVALGRAVPALRGELFPSRRRKVVCVVQGIVLLVALGPIIPDPMAVVVVALGLAMLSWSFAVDTAWLLRTEGGPPPL